MATYTVWISFSGCASYEVEAESEDEAIDMAMNMAEVSDCDDWDYRLDSIVEEN